MTNFIIDGEKFKEIEQINTSLRSRSSEAVLLKINNRRAKKFLRVDNSSDLIDLNSNKSNKRREYDRYQIKERLRKKLKQKNEESIKNMFSSDEDQEFLDKLLNN